MIDNYFEIKSTNKKIINGNIRYNENHKKKPLIIISHGFKGFKDWGFLPYVGEYFAEHNAISVVFNYSSNGKKSGLDLMIDVDEFCQFTLSQAKEDLDCLISNFIHDGLDKKSIEHWNGDIYLAGHSMGGGFSLVCASSSVFVKKVSIWASIGTFMRYTERQKVLWKRYGFAEFPNQKTGQVLKMNVDYLNDLEKNYKNFDIENIIKSLVIPLQIINAAQDATIQKKETEILIENSNKELTRIDTVPRTGHTFGIDHPMKNTSTALENLLNLSLEFFELKK
jgi:predicted alpha/beta-fold hydrolase